MNYSVLVIGGGAAGLAASMKLAEAGVHVVLVEKQPVLGGALAGRLNNPWEKEIVIGGAGIPSTHVIAQHPRIEMLTSSEVVAIEGEPGQFRTTIRRRSRFVTDACTLCNDCREVCPVVLPNEFEGGLTARKAIHLPLPQATPQSYVIDIDHCLNEPPNYLACQHCVEACADHAIDFDSPPHHVCYREIGAVVLAVGGQAISETSFDRYGYGHHPDIFTVTELEGLLTPTGPTGGFVEKLTNEACPESLLFVLSNGVGSPPIDSVAYVGELLEQGVGRVTVLHEGDAGNGSGKALTSRLGQCRNVDVVNGKVRHVRTEEDHILQVSYSKNGANATVAAEMIVIAPPLGPPSGLRSLAELFAIELAPDGYVQTQGSTAPAIETTRAGVFAVGCAREPAAPSDCLIQADAVTDYVQRLLDRRQVTSWPDHQSSSGEEAQILAGPDAGEAVRNQIEQALWALLNRVEQ